MPSAVTIDGAFQAVKEDDLRIVKRFVKQQRIAQGSPAGLTQVLGTRENEKKASTMLHWAAYIGSSDIIELLLGNGAQIDPLECDMKAPLHWAAFEGHAGAVSTLLAHGADYLIRDQLGNTPCHLALLARHAAVAELFPNYKDVIFGSDFKPEPPVDPVSRSPRSVPQPTPAHDSPLKKDIGVDASPQATQRSTSTEAAANDRQSTRSPSVQASSAADVDAEAAAQFEALQAAMQRKAAKKAAKRRAQQEEEPYAEAQQFLATTGPDPVPAGSAPQPMQRVPSGYGSGDSWEPADAAAEESLAEQRRLRKAEKKRRLLTEMLRDATGNSDDAAQLMQHYGLAEEVPAVPRLDMSNLSADYGNGQQFMRSGRSPSTSSGVRIPSTRFPPDPTCPPRLSSRGRSVSKERGDKPMWKPPANVRIEPAGTTPRAGRGNGDVTAKPINVVPHQISRLDVRSY